MTRSVDQAIAAAQAQSQHGPQFGTGWCLKEVQGLYAVPPRDPDATTGWARTTARHPGDRNAPRGGICWWTGGSAGHGHVALSAGGGRIWSTDIRRPGYFDLVPLSDIETKWGLTYAGWSEDIEGVRVYGGDTPPPAPRKRHKRTYFVDLHPTYQHGFDFKAARAAGIRAAVIKCTDGEHGSYGAGYTDMVKGAQGNDMGVAAYHWLYGGDAAYIRAQALNLAAHIGDKSIPVFVDVEKSSANSANIGHLVEFTAAARSLGLTVVVDYLPRWYWTSLGSPSLDRVDLTQWNSAYGPNLPLPPKAARVANVSPGRWSDMGGKHVRLLQFGSRVKVGGMAVDCSVYRGPVTHLSRWFKMPQATPPPPPPPPPVPAEWVGFVNAKGGTANTGARCDGHLMAPSDERIGVAMKTFNRENATVLAFAEFNNHQGARITHRHHLWELRSATADKVTTAGSVGSALTWRSDVWDVVGTDEIVVPDTKSNFRPPVLDLHYPVARLRHHETGVEVTFVAVHFPAGTRPVIASERTRCMNEVMTYLRGVSGPAVVLGDLNAVSLPPLTDLPGGESAIDQIRARGLTVLGSKALPQMHGAVTDHAAGLVVELELLTL